MSNTSVSGREKVENAIEWNSRNDGKSTEGQTPEMKTREKNRKKGEEGSAHLADRRLQNQETKGELEG